MGINDLSITYVGGPTVVLEIAGLRLLTDPTFDAAGNEYTTGVVTLRKLRGPALSCEQVGSFDYVLLSHDQHFDNLDHAGRALLPKAKMVLTTQEAAQRLGGNSVGLKDWENIAIPTPDGRVLQVVATPARHGPEGLQRGAVNGFLLIFQDAPQQAIYVSGDTVWYPGVAEIANRFDIRVAILHLGAARVPAVGSFHLTMTAREAVEAARTFSNALIVPVHFEDWAHFSERPDDITRAFADTHLTQRLCWPQHGRAIRITSLPFSRST